MKDFKIKLFADGANLAQMVEMAKLPHIAGFTTNPSLLRKEGVKDYKAFAKAVLAEIKDKPISFEVFADDPDGMYDQAKEISSWGENVFVKIPVSFCDGSTTDEVIHKLRRDGVKINVTAVFSIGQVKWVVDILRTIVVPANISIFAGRIADTGLDPELKIRTAFRMVEQYPWIELIWASPREVYNVYQAEKCGCHIITATPDILSKLGFYLKNLDEYSIDTVKQFYNDAQQSGLTLL